MNYVDKLKESAKKHNSLVCLGMDPVIEKIPLTNGSIKERIIKFYEEIMNEMVKSDVLPSAVKPNYAFYAQYGIGGIEALVEIIKICKEINLPVILDVKRGDIGTTAAAYAKESFDFFKADAVTLAPYMGYDSIGPFADKYPEKGFYILNKTSNKSSIDLQDLMVGNEPLYMKVSKKIIDWHKPGMGAVVGATYADELKKIADLYKRSEKEIPLLIPGIGSQGGSINDVMSVLNSYDDIKIHRINSSSGINYAYLTNAKESYNVASVSALKELNDNINSLWQK